MGSLLQDVRYGFRQLAKSPAFTAVVVLSLALGIGAATAMFAVVDRVLLRPLPYQHPERLVNVDEAALQGKSDLNRGAAYIDLKAWQQQNKTFDQIAYYTTAGRGNFGLQISNRRLHHRDNHRLVEDDARECQEEPARTATVRHGVGHDLVSQANSFTSSVHARSIRSPSEVGR